ncbi:Hypothetical predicted protein, partial [Lynx pardinus]
PQLFALDILQSYFYSTVTAVRMTTLPADQTLFEILALHYIVVLKRDLFAFGKPKRKWIHVTWQAFSRSSRQEYGAADPGFTMRRKMEHLREEREQIRQLRNNLESRLKVILPDDIGAALMDGVVLCHLANHIRPRSVASIHVPSPAVPKLSMAKCRRNVENFLDACKKLGVSQERLCLPHHILEERGLVKVGVTVQALLELPTTKASQLSTA